MSIKSGSCSFAINLVAESQYIRESNFDFKLTSDSSLVLIQAPGNVHSLMSALWHYFS